MRERFCENVNTSIAMATSYQAVVLALVVEKPLKDVCTVVVFSLGCIVGPDHSVLDGHLYVILSFLQTCSW